jgi:hypothetical protein
MRDFFERYGPRIRIGAPDECWEWTASRIAAGYGHFTRYNRQHYSHRSAYEAVHGPGSADGLLVRHRCDNPPCCNPAHLQTGTHADNHRDMMERGRDNPVSGEAVNTAKLTESDVAEARRLAAAGMPIARLIERFPIAHTAMHAAVTGRTWTHLPGAVTVVAKAIGPGATPGASPTAILTEAKVREIKQALRSGSDTGAGLARRYGVGRAAISAIKKRRNWAHVD